MGRTRTGRAAPLAPEDRRRAIVEAVLPLLATRGANLTTREIAEAAGVAEGTIFRVFDDKHALLMAVAEETLNPRGATEALLGALDGVDDLESVVRIVTARMFERSDQVLSVLAALRGQWLARAPGEHRARGGGDGRQGPPAFVVRSHRALLDRLTKVFEPYADELAVSPQRAALILRTLVLGSRHPGMSADERLGVEEVTAVLLHGIRREARR